MDGAGKSPTDANRYRPMPPDTSGGVKSMSRSMRPINDNIALKNHLRMENHFGQLFEIGLSTQIKGRPFYGRGDFRGGLYIHPHTFDNYFVFNRDTVENLRHHRQQHGADFRGHACTLWGLQRCYSNICKRNSILIDLGGDD